MDGPPPPPPPHGEKPNTTHGEYRKASDLPEGHYDIFIIPPHSSGSGFLYLPSLQCHRNSFIAGSLCTLLVLLLCYTLYPIVRVWYSVTMATGGGMGIAILVIGVGVAGWAFGASQGDNGTSRGARGRFGPGGFGSGGFGPGGPASADGNGRANGQSSRTSGNYSKGSNFGGNHSGGQYGGGGPNPGAYPGNQYGTGSGPPPQSPPPPPKADPPPNAAPPPNTGSARNTSEDSSRTEWERAREEAKRKEELKRKMDAFKRKREAEQREKQKQRDREEMEKELKARREQLEKEMAAAREAAEKEAREKAEREAAEAKAKAEKEAAEAKEREEKAAAEAKAKAEREAAEAKAKAEREAAEKEAAAKEAAKREADAKFKALKEAAAKKYAEKKAKDAAAAKEAAAKEAAGKEAAAKASTIKASVKPPSTTASAPRTPSPKKPPFPSAKTATEDDDAYSFRPYDRPRRPYGGASAPSVYSESSYAPSHSTARTTPPPSNRGPYATKDPDKVVIRAVYAFNNAFNKTPIAHLVSGQGMVTDGLVLRITTEGLFIDDDRRGVPQREWDVKAWTMKLVEVWCPQFGATSPHQSPSKSSNPFRRGTSQVPTSEESDAYLVNLLKVCKNTCRLASPTCFSRNGSGVDRNDLSSQSAELGGLHIVRASLRDQEGKKYVFVLQETEGWKVAIGLQRLRKGSQVRALGVSSMPVNECKSILSNLGYI